MFYGKYNLTSLALLMVLFISPACFAANNTEVPIKLMTEIFPPFQYKHKDEVIGVSTDIVNAIQKELKLDNKIEVYLWSEAKEIIDNTENTALFSMLRTAEREKQYKWVGPLSTMKLVFFKKKGSTITLNSIDDAKRVGKVGVTKGVANFEMLSNQGFTNLEVLTNSEDEENIRKLVNGEIDLWPTLFMAGLYNSRLQGLSGEIEPIKDVIAFSGDLYIAFNLQTDDAIIQKWQHAFDKLKKDQLIEEIINRYEFEKPDYSLFIKLLVGVLLIIAIVVYHNRKLSCMNKKLNELQGQLQKQADHDYLTQLYNRRYFDQVSPVIINLGKRNKQKTSIILIDIDDFKSINDTYGHHTGDDVIKYLSSCLLQHVRESDIVARIGGEEFVILLPGTNIEGSINIASKIRVAIENSIINSGEKNSLKFTISLGVDEVLENDTNIRSSLNRADEALYKAKATGKNKVEYIAQ